MLEQTKRKPNRLNQYDYSTPGAYFITICTKNKEKMLSSIVGEGLAPPEPKLSNYGKIAEQQLLNLEERYPNVTLDKYVIMPNHIHLIVVLRETAGGASPSPTISDIICTFKSLTSRLCKVRYGSETIFQRSFHDHIIRNQDDYDYIWNYMELNPMYWKKDCFYIE